MFEIILQSIFLQNSLSGLVNRSNYYLTLHNITFLSKGGRYSARPVGTYQLYYTLTLFHCSNLPNKTIEMYMLMERNE